MKKKVLLLGFLGLLSSLVIGQTGSLRGHIYDQETGDPILYANIVLKGTDLGAISDVEGFFNFPVVPPGTYELVASYLGYDSLSTAVSIRSGQISYQRLLLTENAISLKEVNVSARREEARSEVQISSLNVSPGQIRSLPSTGGAADIAQYLSLLPGVIFTGDQGGQLYIRGGSPIQNKVLLDGMTIYKPFHSIGFFSVFETETIRSVEVLTGGFNAEYGGRISAIVDIKTREGNKKNFGGYIGLNPFQSNVLLEGPIKKMRQEGGGSISYLFTGKHSYIDQTSKTIYPYTSDTLGLPYSFTDLYGKISFIAENGSKLNVFGFNFKDRVEFAGISDLDWNSVGGGLNFLLVPATTSMIINGKVNFSNYEITLRERTDFPRNSSINGFTAGLDFTFFGRDNEIKYGFEINGFNTDFRFRNFLGIDIEQEDFTTEIAAFVKYKQQLGGLILEPSFRIQYYASLSDFSFEPRLGLKYNATGQLRFKLAGGLYSQNLISTVNERDIVNLFVGFLSGPEETIFKTGTTERTDHRLQTAAHAVAGVELDLTDDITINVEPYYKRFTQLININRNKLDARDPNFATETGDAYGVDLLLHHQGRQLNLWLAYSLGYVNRYDGQQEYPTIFDRRHNLNLLTGYRFGEDLRWEANVRWNLGSGFPFSLTQGFYHLIDFAEGLDTDITTANGELGIIYDEQRNAGRLPYYHRLDLSLKRTFSFSTRSQLELVISLTNAYNRKNIFFFDRVAYDRVDQLPVLPSLGLSFKF